MRTFVCIFKNLERAFINGFLLLFLLIDFLHIKPNTRRYHRDYLNALFREIICNAIRFILAHCIIDVN